MIGGMKYALFLLVPLAASCGLVQPKPDRPGAVDASAPAGPFAGTRPQARPGTEAAAMDAPADVIEAAQPATATPPASGRLGTTVASLGNAAEPGMWIKTPLVRQAGTGTITYPETGRSVEAQLIPLDGPPTAGSRVSLAAMQELGAPLTGLPELVVSR